MMKECKCTVIEEKAKFTPIPNLKGLQIKGGGPRQIFLEDQI